MTWDALALWGPDAVRLERLTGGIANDIWRVRVNGRIAVGRLGKRTDEDLAWEAGLLQHLQHNGMAVPAPIPTADGRPFANGLTVMEFVEGGPPQSADDWRRVGETLKQLHQLTVGWAQRPGWRSSTDLLTHDRGTKIDLTAMPAEAVARCRAAWKRLAGRPTAVVHGDPNPGNIRMTAERVALIDWDEAHVDVPSYDLALPGNAAGLDAEMVDMTSQASAAWEAAVCWDDDYAKRRLAEVRPVTD